MLVLSRMRDESIMFGDNLLVTMWSIKGDKVGIQINGTSAVYIEWDEPYVLGDEISITVIDIRRDKVRFGITCPKEVPVHRKEVYDVIKKNERRVEDAKASRSEQT